MTEHSFLTATEVIATATALLEQQHYRRVTLPPEAVVSAGDLRFFEDPYQIIALGVYDSWDKLRDSWASAQSTLIELISRYVGKGDPKAWEGYLVLLTPGLLPVASREEANQIRYNTARVRKLLATGEQLSTMEEVRRTLLPLLPLSATGPTVEQASDALQLLPDILAERGIEKAAVLAVVDAFRGRKPLMERLHQWRIEQ
jgi:hypothetical protein